MFAAQNISNMLYALAALKITPLDVLLKVLSLLALLVHTQFTCFTGTKAQILTRRRLPKALCSEAVRKEKDLKPQELANILWAWATLGLPAPQPPDAPLLTVLEVA